MNKTYSGGYIGLLAILITVAIIAYIMIKQYESYGMIQPEISAKPLGSDNTTDIVSPIQRAKDVKSMVEGRNVEL